MEFDERLLLLVIFLLAAACLLGEEAFVTTVLLPLSSSPNWRLCDKEAELFCGSRGGDVDSLMAWLRINNFTFVFVYKI